MWIWILLFTLMRIRIQLPKILLIRIHNTASFYRLWHLLGIGGQPKRVRRGWGSYGPWPPVWIAQGKEYQREKQEMSLLSQ